MSPRYPSPEDRLRAALLAAQNDRRGSVVAHEADVNWDQISAFVRGGRIGPSVGARLWIWARDRSGDPQLGELARQVLRPRDAGVDGSDT